ncbi:hypothetical protein PISL3812_02992 [Talaromyces islandicus]|uniref:Centromere protein H C-terminal domain-containing protein n=1 Tax=Talaromyces islandicus TaxID=28573 RepID=A0A0U1LRH9_TALIS|nr:hypothetical protein PISL3812_02992 [Talaromyces islandicus]
MASNDPARRVSHAGAFDETEAALLELAADSRQDELSLSSKEEQLLRLYDHIQELDLEQAVLEQDIEQPSNEDVEGQLRIAERELLEARATYTVRKKAAESVLMTDPILKTVHLRGATPAERALLPLVNRRDILSLVYENLANAQASTLKALSDAEVDHIRTTKHNQELARQLLELTAQESSWRDTLVDQSLQSQIAEAERQHKAARVKWDTMKNIASAVIAGSGVDWARDDQLRALVLDELD